MATKSRYRYGNGINGTPDLLDQIVALQKRVTALERAPTAAFTSIGRNGLEILDGGALNIKDDNGNIIIQVGKGPDGNFALVVYDTDGNPQIRAGQLASGGYGLETIDTASGGLVQLHTQAFGGQSQLVQFNEATTSTSPTDLTHVGPTVTVTIGPTGRALVFLSAVLGFGSAQGCQMNYALSGANTRSALSTADTLTGFNQSSNGQYQMTVMAYEAFLSPGVTTFTAKYASLLGGSVTFGQRVITVIPY